MGEFGICWRISVCLHFNTQGTVIDMIWLSHGHATLQVKFSVSGHLATKSFVLVAKGNFFSCQNIFIINIKQDAYTGIYA